MKQVVLTGIKPTGTPHIGNYFGAIKQAIEMSKNDEYDNFYFIADYHALNSLKDQSHQDRLLHIQLLF
jgi:tryptophanyl-tRNA synthetase